MNGEDLVYDWQHNVVDTPSEWAFNWSYAEGGTSQPTPREHHATLWLIMNVDNPSQAIRAVFNGAQQSGIPCKLKIDRDHQSGDGDSYRLSVTHKTNKKKVFLQGKMGGPDRSPDPNVGNYAVLQSTSEDGLKLIKKLMENCRLPGHQAYIEHRRVETTLNVNTSYRVVSVTGFGPDWEEKDGPEAGLATRFTLFHEDEEVARCHMTYKDGSYDPSLGPTIEMIAVKQSRRGEGLAKVLFYWVRRFVEDNFTLECLNNDAPHGHTMIKATQIGTNEVDIRKEKDGSLHPMGFKEFLYDFAEFSVRPQKGAMAFMMGGRRPKDEEAVLYIPLVTPSSVSKRKSCPKPGNAIMREKCGARCCQWCSNVGVDLLRCTRCGISFYCNATCQRQDWKRHKKWCSKSREEVRERLIKEGNMEVDSEGKDVLVMNGPGRSFGFP